MPPADHSDLVINSDKFMRAGGSLKMRGKQPVNTYS
jgi:hypothetical protein